MLVYMAETDAVVEALTSNGAPRKLVPTELGTLVPSVLEAISSEQTFPDGESATVTVDVPGVVVGQPVVAAFPGAIGEPLLIQGAVVNAPDVVTVAVFNAGIAPVGPFTLNLTIIAAPVPA